MMTVSQLSLGAVFIAFDKWDYEHIKERNILFGKIQIVQDLFGIIWICFDIQSMFLGVSKDDINMLVQVTFMHCPEDFAACHKKWDLLFEKE